MALSATFWIPALIAGVVSALLSFGLIRWATKRALFTPPIRERDNHANAVPRVGGIAIVVSFLVVTLAVAVINPDWLNFSTEKLFGFDRNLLGVVFGVIVLSLVNLRDDFRPIAWQIRLAAQILAALIIFWSGIHISWLTNPFGDQVILEGAAWLIVTVWLVGLSNAVNMLDGVDGLAGSVSLVTILVLLFLSISPEVDQLQNALLASIVLGAVAGFMPFNFYPAKAFLGDTGSVFLGFIIGILAIISGGKIATAILVLAIPLIDALVVVITRIVTGRSPFMPDRLHLHHRLLQLGLKPIQITLIFTIISLVLGLVALNSQTVGKIQATFLAGAVVIAFVLFYTIFMKRRGKLNNPNN